MPLPTNPRALVFLGGLLFATGGAATKACAFDTWQVAGFRSAFAALVIFALIPGSRRAWSRATLVVAAAYAAMLTLFIASTKLTTSANAVFLQSTAPLYIFALSPIVLRERTRRAQLIVACAIGIGLTVIFLGEENATSIAPNPTLGNLLGVASGICWALTIVGIRKLAKDDANTAATSVLAGNVLAALIAMPFALPIALPSAETITDWAWLAYLGVAQVGLAYVFVTKSMPRVPAFEASLILMVEPALNPVFTWALHGEEPSGHSWVGGSLILLALVGDGLRQRRGARAN